MTRSARALFLLAMAGAAGLLPASAVFGQTTAPAGQAESQKELLDEVRALRSEVEALKKQQTAPKPIESTNTTAPTTTGQLAPASQLLPDDSTLDMQKSTRDAVQADAQNRSNYNLMSDLDNLTSGVFKDRFILQSDDGNFVLRPWLHLQFRDATTDRQDYTPVGDQVDNGFEVRRLRFGFDGNMFTPDLIYFFNWATVRANGTSNVTSNGKVIGTVSNNLGGSLLLEEAWVKYKLPKSSFYLKAGQIKDPIYHESIVSSRYQQATERSLTGDIFFNGDSFSEGATVQYDPKGWLRAEAGVDHGLRSANTNFLDYPNTNAYNFGVVGRAEFKAFGRWEDYNMGGFGVQKPLLIAGLGSEMSERGHANQTVAVADIMYANPEGLSLFGSFTDRYTDHNFGIATQSATGASITAPPASVLNTATNEYSLVGEAGYLFFNHLEPFGRFEYMHLQGTAAGSHNYVPVITGGANYYFFGHRCKLTAQGVYLPDGIPIDDTPNDILASPGKHGEFLFVSQLQLLI